jgi:hypothetical protein
MLNLFSFHLISSHRSFSWKLLIASHCVIPSHLISPHAVLSQRFSPPISARKPKKVRFWSFSTQGFSKENEKHQKRQKSAKAHCRNFVAID